MLDILFIAFLGEREPEELLPEDEAERDRLLQDINTLTTLRVYSRKESAGPVSSVWSRSAVHNCMVASEIIK